MPTGRLGDPVPGMPDLVNGLFQALETYDSPLDMSALAATYEVTPTALEDFVHAFVSSATTSARNRAGGHTSDHR